jgi:hypothetical protein
MSLKQGKQPRMTQSSGLRIPLSKVENINAKIKVFKITSKKYRNRRKRFGLRMPLICGIINFVNQN